MDINNMFPSRFLKASDLQHSAPVVVIDRVEVELLGGGQGRPKESKPVVYFRGKEKGLVLNKVNAQAITEITGSSDTDRWLGVSVQLHVVTVAFGGEVTEALRVRIPIRSSGGKAVPPPAEPEPQEWIADDGPAPF